MNMVGKNIGFMKKKSLIELTPGIDNIGMDNIDYIKYFF
jgi:hypothetical protein